MMSTFGLPQRKSVIRMTTAVENAVKSMNGKSSRGGNDDVFDHLSIGLSDDEDL